MKKQFYIVVAFFMVFCAQAQVAISQAEYFWDTDPGQGLGTAVLATDGNFNSAFEALSKTSITAPSVGFHKFCIRVKDNTGIWGPVFTNVIKVEAAVTAVIVTISQAEYFWDTDPGAGSAIALLAFDNNFDSAFEKIYKNAVTVPQTVGFHTLNVRVKDNTGIWGPVFRNVVKVNAPLSTGDFASADAIRLYPNPVKESFKVEHIGAVTSMKLYDMKGSVVKVIAPDFEGAINISGLQSGIYLLKVEGQDGKVFSARLLKE